MANHNILRKKERSCEVLIHNIYAGLLKEDENGGYTFIYDDNYIQQHSKSPVCLAMPTSQKVYHSKYLFPYFASILSEGENRLSHARIHHISKDDDFGILLKTTTYDTLGAVTTRPITQ